MENEQQVKRTLDNIPGSGLAYSIIDYIDGWSRKYSIWPIHLVTGCCSPEFMQVSGSRFDMERLGILPFASVRQCDCIMVVGIVSRKMAERVKYLHNQMVNQNTLYLWVLVLPEKDHSMIHILSLLLMSTFQWTCIFQDVHQDQKQ